MTIAKINARLQEAYPSEAEKQRLREALWAKQDEILWSRRGRAPWRLG